MSSTITLVGTLTEISFVAVIVPIALPERLITLPVLISPDSLKVMRSAPSTFFIFPHL
jgi:hypothetical protein